MRVWVMLGFVVGFIGLSVGIWVNWGGVSVKWMLIWLMGVGGLIVLCVVVREPSVIIDVEGKVIRVIDGLL